MVAMLCDLPSTISFEEFIMPEISFATVEIYSQFPARRKISWELGFKVPKDKPALIMTSFH